MPVYCGLTISGSIFIGKVKIFTPNTFQITKKTIASSQTEAEILKLKNCIQKLEAEITEHLQSQDTTQIDKEVLETHLMILTDIEISQMLENAISGELMSAPQAVNSSFEEIILNFEKMENSYMAQRADDYKDVSHRLLSLLLGEKKEDFSFNPDDIVFTNEITPSLVSRFAQKGLKAYCIEKGSYVSHSSILTRALGLTAIVIKENILPSLNNGDTVILDPVTSCIIINPEPQLISEYSEKQAVVKDRELYLQSLLSLPAETKNNKRISLKANIEYPGELVNVTTANCDGIGLFRTEFLYLNRQTLPDEAEQVKIYSDILTGMKGLPVTIRTFDLGGDKLSHLISTKQEENPYLGCRGIRLSMQHKTLFKTQIRAILKASVHGKANIMFPMIIGVEDFLQAKAVVDECKKELLQESINFDKEIPIGVMIETPSAALSSAGLAKVCDFFSLGTNDLVQYTLAVDRNNDNVTEYYLQHHPAVLLLIKQTINSANNAGIPVSVCGEMASINMYVPLLVGMGIEEFSINPFQTLPVKAIVRNCDKQLFDLMRDYDFNTDLKAIELLLKETLNPYYNFS